MTRIMMPRPGFRHIPRAHDHISRQACDHRHVATNILKTENGYDIELAVPGVDKSNIEIYVKKDILHIEAKTENREEGPKYNLKQFDYGNFSKRFEISDEIDTDKIEANYQEGVLTVRLSKKDLSKAEIERKIDIK